MVDTDSRSPSRGYRGGFWRSRAGIVLIAFLSAGAFLLAYEHRAHVFTGSGLLVLLLALCVGMHFFMHGAHGRNGGHGDDAKNGFDSDKESGS